MYGTLALELFPFPTKPPLPLHFLTLDPIFYTPSLGIWLLVSLSSSSPPLPRSLRLAMTIDWLDAPRDIPNEPIEVKVHPFYLIFMLCASVSMYACLYVIFVHMFSK